MDEKSAFLRRICEEPDEDVHRLVYADWLDENGESERAEFVRLQVELAKHDTQGHPPSRNNQCATCNLLGRERELLSAFTGNRPNWGVWSMPLWDTGILLGRPWHERMEFTRGFVSHVTLTQGDFLRHAGGIFAAHPVTAVTLSDKNTDWVHLWNESNITEDAQNENIASELFEVAWEQNPDAQRSADSPTPWLCFVNNQELRAALSAACVAYGRERAKLPALVTAASRPAASH